MMTIPKPIIPKEYGAWAVLFVPMVVGIIISGKFSLQVLWLALSAFSMFMSYVPIHTLLRIWAGVSQRDEEIQISKFWGAVYLSFGVMFILPLLQNGFWLLLPIGAVGGISYTLNFFLTRLTVKSIASDLIAVLGLTLSAPSAYYIVTGVIDQTALTLWLLNFLFFGCSIFYVHMKIQAISLKKSKLSFIDKMSVGKLNLLYHISVLTIVILLMLQHYTPRLAVIAFLPMVVHGIYGTLKLKSSVRFKNLGFLLLGQSVLFGFLLCIVGLP